MNNLLALTSVLVSFLFISCTNTESQKSKPADENIKVAEVVKTLEVGINKCFGGNKKECAEVVCATKDGGSIIAGHTESEGGDVKGNHGKADCLIIKLNASGEIDWSKCYGGNEWEHVFSIVETSDGGYIFAGDAKSSDGDVVGLHEVMKGFGSADAWVVKLDSKGDILWSKCLGGNEIDKASCVAQTSDGDYIVSGNTYSTDGDVTGFHGEAKSAVGDGWIVKLDAEGKIVWNKCIGGSQSDNAQYVQQTSDGGYIVAGYTESNDGDVKGNHGSSDFWLAKLDANGELLWNKCYGGKAYDWASSVQETKDGGFILAGNTSSTNGDVSGNHGGNDYWVVKVNANGNIEWSKCFGGSSDDWGPYSVEQTNDEGFIVAGYTESTDGDVSSKNEGKDYWIVKLDAKGSIEWNKCFGGSGNDLAKCVKQTTDGEYFVAGYTESFDSLFNNRGMADFWILKLDALGNQK